MEGPPFPPGKVSVFVKTALWHPAPFNNQEVVSAAAAAMEPLTLPDDVELPMAPDFFDNHPDFIRPDGTHEPVLIGIGRLLVERQLNVDGTTVDFPVDSMVHIIMKMNDKTYIRAYLHIIPKVLGGVEAVLYAPPMVPVPSVPPQYMGGGRRRRKSRKGKRHSRSRRRRQFTKRRR